MSLYQKHRPKSFELVKGNKDVIDSLKAMTSDLSTCPHSFLLHGQTGCGKTTLARIIANVVGCVGTDYREVDSADFRGIDTIREIRKNSEYLPMEGDYRVWVIDECHKLTNDAQNALLKILEDTPPHVFFVLCTTEPQKLISTIRNRCTQFQLNLLKDDELQSLLMRIVKREKKSLSQDVYDVIIKESGGHPRSAIVILEKVLSVSEDKQLEIAIQANVIQTASIDLCRALFKKAPWGTVNKILAGLKDQEAESIRRVVLGYCSSVLLKSDNVLAGRILEEFLDPFYDSGFPQLVYACYAVTNG